MPAKKPQGRLRHLVLRNMGWNWAGMVVEIFSGFVVAPFLVRKLGVSGYGLWIVIGSLSGYFSLIDLGLRGSVARQLSLHRANEQWDHFNQTFNSALAILCGLGGITLPGAAVFVFDRLFEVHPDQIRDAKLALALVGVNLALSFPLQIFDGSLWAAQRFDLLNAVDIPLPHVAGVVPPSPSFAHRTTLWSSPSSLLRRRPLRVR